jgi:serine/threonine-protein kinase HipA
LDGDDFSTGASYLDFVPLMQRGGANSQRDLEQLWRRIVFFICISNTDDHLRNHGFILEPGGWALAPAYDMNPNPQGDGLTLNISESDNSQDLDLARSVRKHFRVGEPRGETIIHDVVHAVSSWKKVAASLKIPPSEQARMASAFRWAPEE